MKKQINNHEELLKEARQSLRAAVRETAEAYQRSKSGELEGDDYEELAHAYLAFMQWAVDWLKRAR